MVVRSCITLEGCDYAAFSWQAPLRLADMLVIAASAQLLP